MNWKLCFKMSWRRTGLYILLPSCQIVTSPNATSPNACPQSRKKSKSNCSKSNLPTNPEKSLSPHDTSPIACTQPRKKTKSTDHLAEILQKV